MQCTTSLLGGSGQWNSCHEPPACSGAVSSGTLVMHCLTAQGQWAVQLLQYTASLPGGSRHCNSCNALPHHLGQTGSNRGVGQRNSCNAGPPIRGHRESCPGGGRCLKSGIPAANCLTDQGRWAVGLLQRTGSMYGGRGQWNSWNTLPHCLGAVGIGPHALHCRTTWGQKAAQSVRCISKPFGPNRA